MYAHITKEMSISMQLIITIQTSLRSKRFQSSYSAKVNACYAGYIQIQYHLFLLGHFNGKDKSYKMGRGMFSSGTNHPLVTSARAQDIRACV